MMKMKSEECRMKKQRSAAKGKANRLAHTLLLIAICFMASMTPAMAQQNSDRRCPTSMRRSTTMRGSILPTATSSGTSAPRAVMSVLRVSGTTTAVMVSASPTSPVWREGAITMATCVSVRREEATPMTSWVASTSAMSITIHSDTVGNCFGRSRLT